MSAEIFIFPSKEPEREPSPYILGAFAERPFGGPETVTEFFDQRDKSIIRWERMGPGWWFCFFVFVFYLWSVV